MGGSTVFQHPIDELPAGSGQVRHAPGRNDEPAVTAQRPLQPVQRASHVYGFACRQSQTAIPVDAENGAGSDRASLNQGQTASIETDRLHAIDGSAGVEREHGGIHVEGHRISARQINRGDIFHARHPGGTPVGGIIPVAPRRIIPCHHPHRVHRDGHGARRSGLEAIGGPVGEAVFPHEASGWRVGEAPVSIGGHGAAIGGGRIETGHGEGIPFGIDVVGEHVRRHHGKTGAGDSSVIDWLRGAVRDGHATLIGDLKLGEHPVAMSDPTGAVVR